MTAPSRAYTPGTDVIDITAPGGIEQLLEFHRATFGAAVMRANLDGDPVDDGPDDDEDPADDDLDDDGDPADDDGDADDDEGREQLGDKGQKALDRMKERRKADRARIRQLQEQLAAKNADGDAGDTSSTTDSTTVDKKTDRRIVRSEVKSAAKGVLADPKDALTFLDLDQFEVDENGDVDEDEIAEAIAELVEKKPYLAAQGGRRFKGSAGGGAGKQSRTKQLTEADIDRLSPEQIVEARRKGQLDGLLKGTR